MLEGDVTNILKPWLILDSFAIDQFRELSDSRLYKVCWAPGLLYTTFCRDGVKPFVDSLIGYQAFICWSRVFLKTNPCPFLCGMYYLRTGKDPV